VKRSSEGAAAEQEALANTAVPVARMGQEAQRGLELDALQLGLAGAGVRGGWAQDPHRGSPTLLASEA
jgi:hypothetical protein